MKNIKYTLLDLIKITIGNRIKNLHTANVGIIQSYNPSTQKADVAISFFVENADGEYENPVVIPSVPVFVLSGGQASITMPIEVGDNCILLFGEQSLDDWKQSAGGLVVPIGTDAEALSTHNLTDAIAIVGVNPFPLASPSTGTLRINNGSASVNLSTTSVGIGANGIEALSTIAKALNDVALALAFITPVPPAVQIASIQFAVAQLNLIAGSL
jgi:hypothetical protein